MLYFVTRFEMLEDMFAVNVSYAAFGEGPAFAQVELQVGSRVKQINVNPSGFWIWTAPEVELVFRWTKERRNFFQSQSVLAIYVPFLLSLKYRRRKSFRK